MVVLLSLLSCRLGKRGISAGGDQALEGAFGACHGFGMLQETRIVMQAEHERAHFEHQLLAIGVRLQIADFNGQTGRAKGERES